MTSQPFPRCLFTHRTGHLGEGNTDLYLEDCGLTTVKRYHHESLWGEKFRSILAVWSGSGSLVNQGVGWACGHLKVSLGKNSLPSSLM